jgi:hypothetical protein
MAPVPLSSVGTQDAPGRVGGFNLASLWPRLETFQWATLAAAALLLVVSSSALTAWVVRVPEITVPAAGEKAGVAVASVGLEALHPVEAEYALEIADLLSVLYHNRDSLDPDTVTTIEVNLRVIDRAIRRAREALEEDPENAGLARMLTHGYRNKLQVLQRANLLIERS